MTPTQSRLRAASVPGKAERVEIGVFESHSQSHRLPRQGAHVRAFPPTHSVRDLVAEQPFALAKSKAFMRLASRIA